MAHSAEAAAAAPLAGPGPVLSSAAVFAFAEQARLAKAANEAYLAASPALARLLADLVRACVQAQPRDARAFAAAYVARYRGDEPDRGQVPDDLGITGQGFLPGGLRSDSLELDDDEEADGDGDGVGGGDGRAGEEGGEEEAKR